MKKSNSSLRNKLLHVTFFGAITISLYFDAGVQDPFNSPKFWILIMLASILAGSYTIELLSKKNLTDSIIVKLMGILIISGFISSLTSNSLIASFFGETMRKNGFLTYLSLSIIFLAVSNIFVISDTYKLRNYVVIISMLLIFYGYLQSVGKDFVAWNNPYNSVILTTGNPNFASAILSIFATFLTISLFSKGNLYTKLFLIILTSLILIIIYKTNSRQGLIAYSISILLTSAIIVLKRNRLIGIFYSLLIGSIIFAAILGTRKIGPLQAILYKDSLNAREFYWKAAIEMFKNHPFFGVGLDNYGNFFNLYRELSYTIKYGFDVTSTNAHNVFLQNFATGGVIFGGSYLLLQIYIFIKVIKLLKLTHGEDFFKISTIFSSWLCYQLISLVSIDNIAVAIWGWLLGGILTSVISKKPIDVKYKTDLKRSKMISPEVLKIQLSFVLALAAIILCSFLYRSEKIMFEARSSFNPSDATSRLLVKEYADKLIKLPFLDLNYKSTMAIYLSDSGFFKEAEKIQKNTLKFNPNSYETLNVLANLYESNKRFNEAIEIRLDLIELNPYNAKNFFQIAKNYKILGQYQESKKFLSEVKKITGLDQFYTESAKELENIS